MQSHLTGVEAQLWPRSGLCQRLTASVMVMILLSTVLSQVSSAYWVCCELKLELCYSSILCKKLQAEVFFTTILHGQQLKISVTEVFQLNQLTTFSYGLHSYINLTLINAQYANRTK